MALSTAALTALATPAGAVYAIGSNLRSDPNADVCGVESGVAIERPCTVSQGWLAYGRVSPAGLASPLRGVVVRWSILVGAAPADTAQFKLGLRTINGNRGGAGGPFVTVPAAAPGTLSYYTFQEHLPIEIGEKIGLTTLLTNANGGAAAVPIVSESPELGETAYWESALLPEQTGIWFSRPNTELLLRAEIEPDADRDGLGDETQDACPNLSGPQSCPSLDRIPPVTAANYEKRQAFPHSGRLVVRLRSNEAGTAIAGGMVEVTGRGAMSYPLRSAHAQIRPNHEVALRVRLPRRARAAARQGLAAGHRVLARVSVAARDASGNETSSKLLIQAKP
ncbi:MAG: hypothetical protein ACOYD4_16425 [Solirubrobacterales bacterium]